MSEPIDPILLRTVLPLQKLKRGGGRGLSAEEVTNLSQDTLRRNYPHLIRASRAPERYATGRRASDRRRESGARLTKSRPIRGGFSFSSGAELSLAEQHPPKSTPCRPTQQGYCSDFSAAEIARKPEEGKWLCTAPTFLTSRSPTPTCASSAWSRATTSMARRGHHLVMAGACSAHSTIGATSGGAFRSSTMRHENSHASAVPTPVPQPPCRVAGGRLHCVKCGADRGPLRRDTINFIQAIESRFGPITDPVVLRKGERGQ